MNSMLTFLSNWLFQNNLIKEAQQIKELEPKEWAEPWHEEATKEFDQPAEEELTEEDYLEKTKPHPVDLLNYQDKIRPITPKNIDFLLEICRKLDFYPVSTGDKGPVIGKGAEGTVLRGIYDGQPAVIKIHSQVSSEIKTWEHIQKNFNNISAQSQKYFPKIYLLKSGSFTDKYQNLKTYSAIIMEELLPLPNYLKSLIEYGKESTEITPEYQQLIKNPEFLYEVSKTLIKEIGFSHDSSLNPANLMKILYQNFEANKSLQENFDKTLNKILEFFQSYDSYFKGESLNKIIFSILQYYFNFHAWKQSLSSSTNDIPYQYLPETQNFLQALEDLENIGVYWSDLHEDNLMMGKDGNLKIIDVGQYRITG